MNSAKMLCDLVSNGYGIKIFEYEIKRQISVIVAVRGKNIYKVFFSSHKNVEDELNQAIHLLYKKVKG